MIATLRALLCAFALSLAAGASAQTLVIGTATSTSSIDPHYQLAFTNIAPLRHIYDPLFAQDAQQRLHPALALAWEQSGPLTWRIRLRPGVRFHDGAPFTADDVAFTLARAPNVPNSPASFALYTRAIAAVRVVDALTIEIDTHAPAPSLPIEISTIGIVSRRAAETAATDDFNGGRAAIGTGPFRFVEWQPGQRLVLARNDAYWGDAPRWSRVELRRIPNESARVAALLAGDADIIEAVPPTALASIRARADLALATSLSNRLIWLGFNYVDDAPYLTAANGERLTANPLRDLRVRQAISAAIERTAIVERVMLGEAAPAGQILPAGYPGVALEIQPDALDLARSRRLLAEAGYPDGFALGLVATNDRYVNDAQVAQAVAQMLARVGIQVRLEALPGAVVVQRRNRGDFAMFMFGISSESGETLASLYSLLASERAPRGRGLGNSGHYANPALDAAIARAGATADIEEREALTRAGVALAMGDVAIVPLYFTTNTWAMRRGLRYTARADGYTLAAEVRAD
jgi:peptide/nickel transport system substrate-binding protein